MRLTKEASRASRARVIEAAGRLFRENGIDGASVLKLMRAAGLTHGGFYNQFASKEQLAGRVCRETLEASAARIDQKLVTEGAAQAYAAIVDGYLSVVSRDAPGKSCTIPALAGEVSRAGPEVKQGFAAGVAAYLASLEAIMPGDPSQARSRAQATLASMVGALSLARALSDENEVLSDEILAAVRLQLAPGVAVAGIMPE